MTAAQTQLLLGIPVEEDAKKKPKRAIKLYSMDELRAMSERAAQRRQARQEAAKDEPAQSAPPPQPAAPPTPDPTTDDPDPPAPLRTPLGRNPRTRFVRK